jgi:hypothetical protein
MKLAVEKMIKINLTDPHYFGPLGQVSYIYHFVPIIHCSHFTFRVLKMCCRPSFTFTFSSVNDLSSMGFPTIFMFMWIVVIAFCWSISSYRLLLLLQSTEHQQIHHFLNISNSRWHHGGNSGLRLHNISDFTWFYYIDARSVPSGVFAHEGCAVVTFQKLGYPFTERKNKQGNQWRFNGFSVI